MDLLVVYINLFVRIPDYCTFLGNFRWTFTANWVQ